MTAKEQLEALSKPFHPKDIEWRIGQAGKSRSGNLYGTCFAYVTNRAIMNRLDEVFGPENWQTSVEQLRPITTYDKGTPVLNEGFLTSIGVRYAGQEELVWKTDGADISDMEAIKGGISGSMKRAAVSLGIGRYLYNLPKGWAVIHDDGVLFGQARIDGKKENFNWSPPPLSGEALPSDDLEFINIQEYLKENYNAEAHQGLNVLVGSEYVLMADLMRKVKATWGKDYYLALYAYDAIKSHS